VVGIVLVAWSLVAHFLIGAGPAFWLWPVVAASLLLAAVSWLDDLRPQPAALRLAVQAVAVALGLYSLGAFDPTSGFLVFQGLLPPAADTLATALLWLWFINLFNFMDGIDGLAAVETISIGGGLTLLGLLVSAPADLLFWPASLAAAALGFLYWNWAPSRIFLGDVGSIPLGYLLGLLLLTTAAAGFWAVALILPLYYLTDATWTLLRRALRGEKIWRAHREHFYQRAVEGGLGHGEVSARIAALNIVLVLLAALAVLGFRALALPLALLAVVALLFMLARQRPPAS
jgi:UDP-N-acetylmuramyl pentapeptide phosphotransferase/UDP-N-acetylglucosamine-1-phosphate transferase